MELFSYILSQSVLCWCIERLEFCKLILYTATLLRLFIVSRSFWMEFLGSSRYKIMSSVNRDSLTTFFFFLPICIPFIFSSCLIALARNSRTMLNRSGDSVHPCLFLTLGEMVSVFYH
jgi:hypothetical protein